MPNPYTSLIGGPTMTTKEQQALIASPELLGLDRQRKMAELLLAEGLKGQPEGQMVSGYYVAPHWTQRLSPVLNRLMGEQGLKDVDEKTMKLAEKLRQRDEQEMQNVLEQMLGKKATYAPQTDTMAGEMISPAIQPNMQEALRMAMMSQNPQVRAMLPTIAEQVMPKPVAPTGEIANYQYMRDKGLIPPNMSPLQYQAFLKTVDNKPEKAPAGYRFMPDGSLEPIKGGPADLKSQQKFAGQENVDTLIAGLRDQYNILKSNEGITSTQAGVVPNVRSALSRSAVGQMVGQTFGTTNQSARNTIAQSRPLLLNAIKEATGMSAKQMDSNAELKMYLAAATDPTLDYEANMNALNQLERLFGTSSANRGQMQGQAPQGNVVDFNALPKRK